VEKHFGSVLSKETLIDLVLDLYKFLTNIDHTNQRGNTKAAPSQHKPNQFSKAHPLT